MTFSPYSAISQLNWQAQDQGIIAWSCDPAIAQASQALTAGSLSLTALILRTQRVASSISAQVATAGATLTANENFAGLFDATGKLVGQTADQTTNWESTGLKTMPLTTPVALLPGTYWVGLLANGTTLPAFARSAGYQSALNIGLSAASYRAASNGAGLTALANISPSANTVGSLFWVALS